MPNLNVAVLGSLDFSKSLGKKSTTSDITFYDLKRGEVTVSLVEPTKYPEKLSSLFFSVSLADTAIVIVEQIGPTFGESVIMLDCVGVKSGFIVLRNFITKEQIAPFIKGTVLEQYDVCEDDQIKLREKLLSLAEARSNESHTSRTDAGSVPVDHYFDVKGVGTVILGCVADGIVRKHDAVRVLPGSKEAEIRSIQKHDDDFDDAMKGDRVGLAIKGVTVEDLDRGTVLTNDATLMRRQEIYARAHLVKYWLNPLREGMVIHVGHWMQFEPARIESTDPDSDWRNPQLKLKLQKDLVYPAGAKGIMTHLEGGKLRIIGTLELV